MKSVINAEKQRKANNILMGDYISLEISPTGTIGNNLTFLVESKMVGDCEMVYVFYML